MARVQIRLCYVFITFILTYFELSRCEMSGRKLTEHAWEFCDRNHSSIVCNYIPKQLPVGIKTVRLVNVDGERYANDTLRTGTFSSDSWGEVTELEISAEAQWLDSHRTMKRFNSLYFVGLKSLEKLQISISDYIKFYPGTLSGLDNLKCLDLVGCRRFDIDDLINSLNVVPNLRRLNISLLNSYREGLKLTDKFFKLISNKNITELDMSATQVLHMNLTALFENCGTLEYLNVSKIILNDLSNDGYSRLCANFKYFDASYAFLPSRMVAIGHNVQFTNKYIPFNLNWITDTKALKALEYINFAGIFGDQKRYIFENVTIFLQGFNEFKLKTLILRDNHFERIDMNIIAQMVALKSLDLSACKIRYLNPGALSSFNALTLLDLSNNLLDEMVTEDPVLFGNLFRKLSKLRNIYLAGNGLRQLPLDIFKFNFRLEIIDLSDNMLTQVSFDTRPLKSIVSLNLTRNKIKSLDDTSMKRLSGLVSERNTTYNLRIPRLVLKDNPISCSDCDSIAFLDWLMKSKLSSDIKCVNEHSEQVFLNAKMIKNVQWICERPKVIIISCVAPVVVLVLAMVIIILMRRCRRQRKYVLGMEDRIALIREGADAHEFVVFLSFSSQDEDFVRNCVLGPLNEHLRTAIGDGRDLVCEGDRDFKFGRPIPDQISQLLKRSSVVIVVLTNDYNLSVHCRTEFDQAFMLEKPIVMMVKDQVDTELLAPLIRDIYETKTRILWTYENGFYALKTPWKNVCTSIIELVDSK